MSGEGEAELIAHLAHELDRVEQIRTEVHSVCKPAYPTYQASPLENAWNSPLLLLCLVFGVGYTDRCPNPRAVVTPARCWKRRLPPVSPNSMLQLLATGVNPPSPPPTNCRHHLWSHHISSSHAKGARRSNDVVAASIPARFSEFLGGTQLVRLYLAIVGLRSDWLIGGLGLVDVQQSRRWTAQSTDWAWTWFRQPGPTSAFWFSSDPDPCPLPPTN
jgi:hypothetical protein